jgi:hypothetical protein
MMNDFTFEVEHKGQAITLPRFIVVDMSGYCFDCEINNLSRTATIELLTVRGSTSFFTTTAETCEHCGQGVTRRETSEPAVSPYYQESLMEIYSNLEHKRRLENEKKAKKREAKKKEKEDAKNASL